VSVARSGQAAWRGDGRALFFLALTEPPVPGKIDMMEVDFEPGTPPRLGTPRQLFKIDLNDLFFDTVVTRGYDVSPDGQRFFVVQRRSAPPNARATQVNLVLNWFDELKAKVPER
jgi:hypothetical protein